MENGKKRCGRIQRENGIYAWRVDPLSFRRRKVDEGRTGRTNEQEGFRTKAIASGKDASRLLKIFVVFPNVFATRDNVFPGGSEIDVRGYRKIDNRNDVR